MGMSEKGCRIIERFTWNSFRGNCPKVDVKNQNLFKMLAFYKVKR